MADSPSSSPGRRPGPGALFRAFLAIGLSGFGGVLPFARRTLVERTAWLTDDDFNETLALCQSLPGPNVINLSVVVGSRFAGPAGALAALAGLVGAPVVLVIVLGSLYGRFGHSGRLPGAMAGLGAAAAGLVISTAAKMARPLVLSRPFSATPFILAAFVGVGLLRLSLPWVLLVLAPLSLAAGWMRRGKPAR